MLNNIQILRAFAALNVVLFHVIGVSKLYHLDPGHLLFLSGWGENGVDVFFVISGFVMVHAHAGKAISPLEFMKLRLHRIVPIYWLGTITLFALFMLLPQMARIATPSPGHLAASLLFVSSAVLHKPPVLYVGWTLEYEMLFYVLFAAGLFVSGSRARLALQAVAIVGLACFTGVDTIIVEFVLGMLAATLVMRRSLQPLAPWIAALGIALFCATIPFKVVPYRVLFWGIPSLLMVWGAAASVQLRSRLLGYLGAASYSIYLVQVIAIPAFYRVAGRWLDATQHDLLAALAVVFSAAAGCLLHQFVEKPIAVALKRPRHA